MINLDTPATRGFIIFHHNANIVPMESRLLNVIDSVIRNDLSFATGKGERKIANTGAFSESWKWQNNK